MNNKKSLVIGWNLNLIKKNFVSFLEGMTILRGGGWGDFPPIGRDEVGMGALQTCGDGDGVRDNEGPRPCPTMWLSFHYLKLLN